MDKLREQRGLAVLDKQRHDDEVDRRHQDHGNLKIQLPAPVLSLERAQFRGIVAPFGLEAHYRAR
jgi:hypothetical protein